MPDAGVSVIIVRQTFANSDRNRDSLTTVTDR